MKLYRISIKLNFQTDSWCMFAKDESDALDLLAEVIGKPAVDMVKKNIVVEEIPVERGVIARSMW